MDYLVTGGAGFIGSNIVEHLVGQGKSVRVFDNFSSGKRENVRAFAGKAEIVEGDLRDAKSIQQVVNGVRFVLHLGAIPSVTRSVEDPRTTTEVNITGTVNLLLAARDAGVKRVVFTSSSSVYGDTPTLPKREEMTPSPLSPYAVHKITGEYYSRVFWRLYGLETISLRYFNVFGPRQDPQSQYAAVIPRFITAIMRDESPIIFGDGKQTRDFSHIDNVIDANVAACEAPNEALGESFNIACGSRISLLGLVDTVNKILGKKIKPKFDPPRPGDILHSRADISKAEKLLGWKPRVGFAEGIAKTIAWYQRQG
ncbi:MAG TPA: SDR family oxidoreductase [Verrucomicrobiae bacterium]|nr:SDR family oxidoreductase [Verrucomicrobiae bacterium]